MRCALVIEKSQDMVCYDEVCYAMKWYGLGCMICYVISKICYENCMLSYVILYVVKDKLTANIHILYTLAKEKKDT